jgi:hypothetical protein
MRRSWVVMGLTILLGATSGCVTSDTLIKLKPDGSGLIVQKTLLNTEMITQLSSMMQGFAKQIGGNEGGQKDIKMPELFSEKEARSRAAKMGEGVAFVSSQKIAEGRMEGQEVTYAFRDITKLRLSEKPEPPSILGLQSSPSQNGNETTFRFSKLPNGHSQLTVVFPPSTKNASSEGSEKKLSTTSKVPATEQMEQAKKLLGGLRIGIAVDVQGRLVRTNSLYQEGTKVTLLEMDFAELLSNETLFQQATKIKGQDLEEAKELLKGLKGFKINLDPELMIEFSE